MGAERGRRDLAGRRIHLHGVVQGVGFRPFVHRLATNGGLGGRVRNDASGVTIEVFGPASALDAFLLQLEAGAPSRASIDAVAWLPIPHEDVGSFTIGCSADGGGARLSLSPDLATCEACLAETLDPSDRRHRYAFTSCAQCGPRFTIANDAPYERAATTMADFTMCAACRREHEEPADRRFHAELNACPACGPALVLHDAAGVGGAATDPIDGAARALALGRIVAVKGLGGYHLACDATSEEAVTRLRARKDRDEKPFAVLVRDLAAAEPLAILGAAERALLASPARPIVLVPRRAGARLAAGVAPGLSIVGLFLPYTPLHHRLLEAVDRPLVMTSANRSGEPILFRDADAARTLPRLADLWLGHDRRIATPCDDSVARIVAGAPVLLRRGRGFVPRPIPVARAFARPVLACGGDWKNAICLGVGGNAWLGPHLGDLRALETYEALEEGVERLCRLLRVRPEVVAHDLHPSYLSARFARELPAPLHIGVQHHHAHVASALGEHGVRGPVLGLAFDGTGFGDDGTSWGGELLRADFEGFERVATFRPLRLAGGDAAIRHPWRAALALLDDAFDGVPPLSAFALFRHVPEAEVAGVRALLSSCIHAPLSHGVGRLFDAVGALLLGRPGAHYEGQVALLCEALASAAHEAPYPFVVDDGCAPWRVDLRPMTRALVADHVAGVAPERIAARFHETLVAASVALVEAASERHGMLPVVLTGGCFQNPRLASGLRNALSARRRVYLHGDVPPGDGGLALGQALVADARSRRCA